MKKMQDYIHLYIGQNVVHVPDDKTTANIHGMDLSAGRVFVNNNDHQMYGELKLSEIKLILRPLESMTEEEYLDIYNLDVDGHNAKFDINQSNRYKVNFAGQQLKEYAVLPYLLSKGFDLFGLKEAGLAVYE